MTYTVLIGNSDDKLGQQEWAQFCHDLGEVLGSFSRETHFRGSSPSESGWQNHCIVFEMKELPEDELVSSLAWLAQEYGQDSIAWLRGETQFAASGNGVAKRD